MAAFKEVGPPTRGRTFTGHRLNDILKPYIADCVARHKAGLDPPKPLNVIVITDGIAEDKPGDYLKVFAQTLDAIDAEPRQLGVQFCQVGDDKVCCFLALSTSVGLTYSFFRTQQRRCESWTMNCARRRDAEISLIQCLTQRLRQAGDSVTI